MDTRRKRRVLCIEKAKKETVSTQKLFNYFWKMKEKT